MEVRRLRLSHFGIFRQQTIELAPLGRLTIVHGPNEAGKSTARRALLKLLFGFERQDPDAEYFGRGRAEVAAELLHQGVTYQATRRARGNRLVIAPEDGDLTQWLGGLERAEYEQIFCLDHRILTEGGTAILRSKGDAARIFFAVATGILHLDRVRARLDEEVRGLLLTRGTKAAINRELARARELEKQIKDLAVDPKQWKELCKAIGRVRVHLEQLAAEQQRITQRLSDLRDKLSIHALVGQYDELAKRLETLSDVPDLDDEQIQQVAQLQPRLAIVEGQLRQLQRQLDKTNSELTRQRLQLDRIPQGPALGQLDLAEVQVLLSRVQQVLADNPCLPQRKRLLRDTLARLRRLVSGMSVEEADRLTAPRVLELAQQWVAEFQPRGLLEEARHLLQLHDRLRDRKTQLEDRSRALARLDAKIRSLPPESRQQIERRLEQLRTLAQLAAEAEQVERELVPRRTKLQLIQKANGLEDRTASDLASWRLPSAQATQGLVARLNQVILDLQKLPPQQEEHRTQLRKLQADYVRLAAQVEANWEERLEHYRSLRDEALADLHRLIVNPQLSADRQPQLLEALRRLEDAIRHMDQLAEKARQAAQINEQRARLEEEIKHHQQRVEQLSRQEEQLKAAEAQIRQEWAEMAAEHGLPDVDLREAPELLEKLAGIRELATEVVVTEEKLGKYHEQVARGLGLDPARVDWTQLRSTIAQWTDDLEHLRRVVDQREKLELQREMLEQEREKLASEVEELEEQYCEARTALERALQSIGCRIPQDLARLPAWFDELLEAGQQWERLYDEVISRRDRVRALRACLGRLAKLANAAGPVRTTTSMDRLRQLAERAREAIALCSEINRSAAQLQDLEQQFRQAQEAHTALVRQLRGVAATCPVDSSEELQSWIEQVKGKADLKRRLSELGAELLERTGAEQLESALAELRALDVEKIRTEHAALERRLQEIAREKDAQYTELGRLQGERQRLEAERDLAVLKRQEYAAVVKRVEELARKYLALQVAQVLFERFVAEYEEEAKRTFHRLASDYFRRITRQAYVELRIDPTREGDEELVVAVRHGPEGALEFVHVDQLSDGTRDQLFLALRLAAIRSYVSDHGPLPVVLDDLLVNFDDDRACATLEVLADLAQEAQVLFFTHHEHLVDLARETLGTDKLLVQRLVRSR